MQCFHLISSLSMADRKSFSAVTTGFAINLSPSSLIWLPKSEAAFAKLPRVSMYLLQHAKARSPSDWFKMIARASPLLFLLLAPTYPTSASFDRRPVENSNAADAISIK